MSRASTKIGFSGTLAVEEVAAYFQAVIGALERGQVTFRQGTDAVQLCLSPQVDVKIKASSKGRKGKIALEVAWTAPASKE